MTHVLSPADLQYIENALSYDIPGGLARTRTDYSGRAMQGRRCFGVVTDARWVAVVATTVAYVLASHANEEPDFWDVESVLFELAESQGLDDMGQGRMIVYWPTVTAAAD